MRRRLATLALTASVLLSGCAANWENSPPTAAPGGTTVLPDGNVTQGQPGAILIAAARNSDGATVPFGSSGEPAAYEFSSGYRVGAGDRLNIRVLGQPDLTDTYNVDASGNISMPLIHTVTVAGMTTTHIERMLTNRLKAGFLRNPSVSVELDSLRPFFILGEVNTAGGLAYQFGMTVQNAVALAGGYTPRAHQGEVLITRRTNEGTNTYKVPVTTQLYPGDIVYVRERWF